LQTVDDGHDTANNWLVMAPALLGVDWTLQLLPFHASASVVVPLEVVFCPTELQTAEDVQERPARVAPAGFGVAVMLHKVPFQDSARVFRLDEPM